jgi:hypothetical protein
MEVRSNAAQPGGSKARFTIESFFGDTRHNLGSKHFWGACCGCKRWISRLLIASSNMKAEVVLPLAEHRPRAGKPQLIYIRVVVRERNQQDLAVGKWKMWAGIEGKQSAFCQLNITMSGEEGLARLCASRNRSSSLGVLDQYVGDE